MKEPSGLKDKLDQIFERAGKFFRRLEGGKEEEMQQIVTTNIVKKGEKFFQRKVITFVPLGSALEGGEKRESSGENQSNSEREAADRTSQSESKAETLPRNFENRASSQNFGRSGATRNCDSGKQLQSQKNGFQRSDSLQEYDIAYQKQGETGRSQKNQKKVTLSSERRRKFELLSEFSSGRDKPLGSNERKRTSLGESMQDTPELEQIRRNHYAAYQMGHNIKTEQRQIAENETPNRADLNGDIIEKKTANQNIFNNKQVLSEKLANQGNLKKEELIEKKKEGKGDVANLPPLFKSVKSMYQEEVSESPGLQKIEEERDNPAVRNKMENPSTAEKEASSDLANQKIEKISKDSRENRKSEEILNNRESQSNLNPETQNPISNRKDEETLSVKNEVSRREREAQLEDLGNSRQMEQSGANPEDSDSGIQYVHTEYVERKIDWQQNVNQQEERNRVLEGRRVKAWDRNSFKVMEEKEEEEVEQNADSEEADSREEFIDGIFQEEDSEEEEPHHEIHNEPRNQTQNPETQQETRKSQEVDPQISEYTVKTREKKNTTFGFGDQNLGEYEGEHEEIDGEYYEKEGGSREDQEEEGEIEPEEGDDLNEYYEEAASDWSSDEARPIYSKMDGEADYENHEDDIQVTTKKPFFNQAEYEGQNGENYQMENDNTMRAEDSQDNCQIEPDQDDEGAENEYQSHHHHHDSQKYFNQQGEYANENDYNNNDKLEEYANGNFNNNNNQGEYADEEDQHQPHYNDYQNNYNHNNNDDNSQSENNQQDDFRKCEDQSHSNQNNHQNKNRKDQKEFDKEISKISRENQKIVAHKNDNNEKREGANHTQKMRGNGDDIITESGGRLRTENMTPAMLRALMNERNGICSGVGTRKFREPANYDGGHISNRDENGLKDSTRERNLKAEGVSGDYHETQFLEMKNDESNPVRGKRVIVSLCEMDSRRGASHDSQQRDHRIMERKIKIQKQKTTEYNLEINSNDTTLEGIRVSAAAQEIQESFRKHGNGRPEYIEIRNGIGAMEGSGGGRERESLSYQNRLGPSMSLNSFLRKIRKSRENLGVDKRSRGVVDYDGPSKNNVFNDDYGGSERNREKKQNYYQHEATRNRKTTHQLPEALKRNMEKEMQRETLSLNEISYDKYHEEYVDNSETIENYKTRVRQGRSREVGRRKVSQPQTSIINNINTQLSTVYRKSRDRHPEAKFQSQRDYSYGEYYDTSFSYQNPNTVTDATQTYPDYAMIDHSLSQIRTQHRYSPEQERPTAGFQMTNNSESRASRNYQQRIHEYQRKFKSDLPERSFEGRGDLTSMERMCYRPDQLEDRSPEFGRESLIDTSREQGRDLSQLENYRTNMAYQKSSRDRKDSSQEVMVKIRKGNRNGQMRKKGGFGELKKMRKGWIDSLRIISSKLLTGEPPQKNRKGFGSERKPRGSSMRNERRFSERKAHRPYKKAQREKMRIRTNEYGYEVRSSKSRKNPIPGKNYSKNLPSSNTSKKINPIPGQNHFQNLNQPENLLEYRQGIRLAQTGRKKANLQQKTPERYKEKRVKSLSKVMTSLNHYVKGMLRESLRKKKAAKKSRKAEEEMRKARKNKKLDVKKVFDDYDFGEEETKYFERLEIEMKNERFSRAEKRNSRKSETMKNRDSKKLRNYDSKNLGVKSGRYSHGARGNSLQSHLRQKREEDLGIRRVDRGVFRGSSNSERERYSCSNRKKYPDHYFKRAQIQSRNREHHKFETLERENRRSGSVPVRSKPRASSEPPAKRTEYIECRIDPKKRISDMKAYIQGIYDRHNRRKEEIARQQMLRLQRESELKKTTQNEDSKLTFENLNQERRRYSTRKNFNDSESKNTASFGILQPPQQKHYFTPVWSNLEGQTYLPTPYFVPEVPRNMTYRSSNDTESRKVSYDSRNQYMSTISMSNPYGRGSRPINESGTAYFISERTSNAVHGSNDEGLSFRALATGATGGYPRPVFISPTPHFFIPNVHVGLANSKEVLKNGQNENFLLSGVEMVHPKTQNLSLIQAAKSKQTMKTLAGGSQNFFLETNSINSKKTPNQKMRSKKIDDPYALRENIILEQIKIPKVNLDTRGEIFLEGSDFSNHKSERTSVKKKFGKTSKLLVSSTPDRNFPKRIKLKNYLPNKARNLKQGDQYAKIKKDHRESLKGNFQSQKQDVLKNEIFSNKIKLPDLLKKVAPKPKNFMERELPAKLLKNVRVSKNGKVYRTSRSPNRVIGINEFDKVVRQRGRLGFGVKGKVSVNSRAESAKKRNLG